MSSNTGLIIFSRYDSKRLPGKALKSINGRALIGHVLDRAKKVKGNYPIVIATSDRSIDDPIAEFATSEKVEIFRGCLDDVAGRALACSKYFGFERIVRICGDRPFHSPELIETLIEKHIKLNLDLATNALIKTFPTGLMTEVLSVSALKKVLNNSVDPIDREHVTRYIYLNPENFNIWNLEASEEGLSNYSLVVDTLEDFDRAQWIAAKLPTPIANASLNQIIEKMKLYHQK